MENQNSKENKQDLIEAWELSIAEVLINELGYDINTAIKAIREEEIYIHQGKSMKEIAEYLAVELSETHRQSAVFRFIDFEKMGEAMRKKYKFYQVPDSDVWFALDNEFFGTLDYM